MNIPIDGDSRRSAKFYTGHKFSKEPNVQRPFSTFPGGLPGIGLLLLRVALATSCALQGVHAASIHDASFITYAIAAVEIVSGVLMLFGFCTPVAAVLIILSEAAAMSLIGSPTASSLALTFYDLALAVAVLMLGPGTFSVDGRLYGRREITIPRR